MTVLRSDLATYQSKALIRTFRAMKDCIVDNKGLLDQRQYLQLSMANFLIDPTEDGSPSADYLPCVPSTRSRFSELLGLSQK